MKPQPPSPSFTDVHHAIVSCERCARLREYCVRIAREKRRAFQDDTYWARPVPGFGDPAARVLLLGLAPAAHGANRTGRLFTGDGPGGSGDFLMTALHRVGFANRSTSQRADDGLQLRDAYVVSAIRCAPPDNKPDRDEIARCLPHLEAEVALLSSLRVVVALGKIGFDTWLQLLRSRGITRSPRPRFGHGAIVRFDEETAGLPRVLLGCFHPSRQNTHTGRLTPVMMEEIFVKARELCD